VLSFKQGVVAEIVVRLGTDVSAAAVQELEVRMTEAWVSVQKACVER